MGIWMNTYSVNFNIVDILSVILHVGWYLECDITKAVATYYQQMYVDKIKNQHIQTTYIYM
jgi:hypothetical protein